ncbi:integrase catalytic domain-containing protein, partial [Cobetia crustatorum]
MDLIGPTRTESRGGKKYILVIVDDFTRFTWVAFLRDKSETLEEVRKVLKRIQTEKGSQISKIRSDHGSEFENSSFEKFCTDQGILHEFGTDSLRSIPFLAPITHILNFNPGIVSVMFSSSYY